MRSITPLNSDWTFHPGFSPEMIAAPLAGQSVRLPHNALDLPMNYFDERDYQKAFCYQRTLSWQAEFEGREVELVFDGAMADTVVWLNGRQLAAHKDGYTPFSVRLTGLLKAGDNLVTVKVDGSENPEIPPFGGQIDYLTYAGIYRDVWLKVCDPVSIARIKIETADELAEAKSVSVRCTLANPRGLPLAGQVRAELCTLEGEVLASRTAEVESGNACLSFERIGGLKLWQLDDPQLYRMRVTLQTAHG